MPETIQLGRQTIRNHGVQVLRIHMHDWIILLLLVVIEIVLNVIEPFHRFVGADMMPYLKYPMKENTIPLWAVPIIAIFLPFVVIITFFFIRRDVYDLHQAMLDILLFLLQCYLQWHNSHRMSRLCVYDHAGLLYSVFIIGVLTDAIKDAVGRPRPDFFWRCFPDGKGVFDSVTGGVQCTGLAAVIKEGHKSFPSGHTSWSFAGLSFLAWYLSGKIKVFDRSGHVAKLCLVFLPLLFASLVGVSRVDDYWHHWQDVFAGAILGMVVASFCYLQFFPPPYDLEGWGPHVYFRMLDESRNSNQTSSNINCLGIRQSEAESLYVQSQHGRETSEVMLAQNTIPSLNDMEQGRRI